MKKYLLLCVVFFTILPSILKADNVSVAVAKQIAKNYLEVKYPSFSLQRNAMNLDLVLNQKVKIRNQDFSACYVFNNNLGGFVIVSADDAMQPILAYSDEGAFDTQNMPEWIKIVLEEYSNGFLQTKSANIRTKNPMWNQIATKQLNVSRTSVAPLTHSKWGQSRDGHNNLTPANSVTGCVATAMAQMLHYHKRPIQGKGQHSYTHPTYGTLSVDYSAMVYDWDNMPNELTSSTPAQQVYNVAQLNYHCGVSVDMDYSPSSSSAFTSNVVTAFQNNFNFNIGNVLARSVVADATWMYMIKSNLDQNRPVFHQGTRTKADGTTAGHLWIIDGYDDNDLLHCNWGFHGGYNGYFSLDNFTPLPNYSYVSNHFMVKDIYPKNDYNIELNASMTLSSSTIQQFTPISIGANIINNGNANFSGDLKMDFVDNNGAVLESIAILSNRSISQNSSSNFTFSKTAGTSLSRGDYKVQISYRTSASDSWKKLKEATFQNPIPIYIGEQLICTNAVNLSCGVAYSGTTVGGSSSVDRYSSCGSQPEYGKERVHTFTLASQSNVTIQLTQHNGVDLDIHLLASCDATACIARGDVSINANLAAGTYYLIVDGYGTDVNKQGTYDIIVNCNNTISSVGSCGNPLSIQCGATISGNTSNGFNDFNNYSCAPQNEYGKELIYQFTISQASDIEAKLTNMSTDLDIHILSACNVNSCIARGDNLAKAFSLPAGTYYLVVDGYGTNTARTGSFDLTLNCTPISTNVNQAGDCANPIAINCGETKSGNTANGYNNFDVFSCASQPEYGKDLVYTFTLTQTSDVTATLSNYSSDVDVHILSACNENSCLARGNITATTNSLAAGTYFIVVDGYGYNTGKTATFDLTLNCTPITNNIFGDCLIPYLISCGQTITGQNTANGFNNFNTYSCGSQPEYGKDLVYRLQLSQRSDVEIKITNLTADLDVHLMKLQGSYGYCNNLVCISRDDNTILASNLDSGDYYIVVDGYGLSTSTVGQFDLTVNCVTASQIYVNTNQYGSMINPISLQCGEMVQNTTSNGTSINSLYASCNAQYTGNEIVYEIEVQEESELEIMIASTGDRLTPILYSQATNQCIQIGANGFLNASMVQPGTYYVIVDGMEDASYIMGFDCTPSAFMTSSSVKETPQLSKEPTMELNVYPNPTQGILNIQLKTTEKGDLVYSLYDITGKQILSQKTNVNGENMFTTQINIAEYTMNEGVYVLNVVSNNQVISKRLVYSRH